MKYVAIGDLHAHDEALDTLMSSLYEKVSFEESTFIFLGDYVDGGPQAKEVLNTLIDYQKKYPHWVFLKGNHEDMMLNAIKSWPTHKFKTNDEMTFNHWWTQGGYNTALSYVDEIVPIKERMTWLFTKGISRDHLTWMKERPLFYETADFLFVHAGFRPGIPIHKQVEEDMLWIRDSFIESSYDFGKRVIYGHTYTPQPKVQLNKIGIDTMTHSYGHITAVILDNEAPHNVEFVTSKDVRPDSLKEKETHES